MQSLKEFKRMNSSELRGFLTGLILGDGSIDKGVQKRSFSIKSINKEFIDYIDNCIKSTTNFKTQIKYTPEHYSCGCNHKDSWEFRIPAHPYFRKVYHYFYNDYRKRRIAVIVFDWLNPRGLAAWYMSDGYVCLVGKTKGIIKDRRMDICTDRYTKEDVELISNKLTDKYNIHTSIIKRNNAYRIRIQKNSYETFINLISPYMVESMKYKLYLGYTNKPDNLSEEAWNFQQSLISATTLTSNVEG